MRERLGVGGMSEVWRAHDQVLGRDVAIKVLAAATADAARPARIRLEARAAAGLHHPNVVEVYDYGEATDETGRARPYVVMELVDGPTLHDLLTRRSLPWQSATRICAQVAAALAAAHARGVVHRDVKPGNVMVTAAGVKLVDFGISAAAGAVDEADGEVLGTPAYLAPERLDGGPVRVATDVYALGLLLYRTLAGHLPWSGSTVTEMVGNHLYAEPAPLPTIAGLPPEVADLCRRCLAKRPQDRPTAAEAARILGAAVGLPGPEPIELPGAEAADQATVAITQPAPRRRRRPAVLVAAAIIVPALIASLASWQSPGPPTPRAEAGTATSAPPARPSTPAAKPTATATATATATTPGGHAVSYRPPVVKHVAAKPAAKAKASKKAKKPKPAKGKPKKK